MALGFTERSAHGEVVPTPVEPPAVAKYAEPLEVIAVDEAYGKVEAVVPVAVKKVEKTEPSNEAEPATERSENGEVVPTPTFPVARILKSVEVAMSVEDATVKSVVLVSPESACTESFANGEELPTVSLLAK
jgi:hypothetical protein